jgi:hypothetical protein
MPDLSESIEVNGKYYCWDFENEQFVQVILKPLENAQIPIKVISLFMQKGVQRQENKRGKKP